MRAIWLYGALLLAAMPALGQPPGKEAAAQALKQVCAQVPCRKITTTLILRKADGSTGNFDTRPYPYFDPDGGLFIYPGETITLGLAKNGSGKPRLLKAVDVDGAHQFAQPAAGEATLEFTLKQIEGKPDMMLNVSNSTGAVIKYDTWMTTVDGRTSSTSSCPVFPPGRGQASFGGIEHWPHPIVSLLIENVRALGASADRACT